MVPKDELYEVGTFCDQCSHATVVFVANQDGEVLILEHGKSGKYFAPFSPVSLAGVGALATAQRIAGDVLGVTSEVSDNNHVVSFNLPRSCRHNRQGRRWNIYCIVCETDAVHIRNNKDVLHWLALNDARQHPQLDEITRHILTCYGTHLAELIRKA